MRFLKYLICCGLKNIYIHSAVYTALLGHLLKSSKEKHAFKTIKCIRNLFEHKCDDVRIYMMVDKNCPCSGGMLLFDFSFGVLLECIDHLLGKLSDYKVVYTRLNEVDGAVQDEAWCGTKYARLGSFYTVFNPSRSYYLK